MESLQDAVALNDLGPIILNSDGTMSRIPNWSTLTDIEQKKTLRLIAARNKKRAEELKRAEERSNAEDEAEKNNNHNEGTLFLENGTLCGNSQP